MAFATGVGNAVAADAACSTNADWRVICPLAGASCLNDRSGNVLCSSPDGGIEVDVTGSPRCGMANTLRTIEALFASARQDTWQTLSAGAAKL
ncbi:hypothetical protein [Variovorax sp. GT1P44]|uniref:hypothetical protein n=1 Tax=Variovorax sp. GT1P44 TaxID=3443742 RepID=UPI003F487EDF